MVTTDMHMHYTIHRGDGVPVVFLHGFGGSTRSFEYYYNLLRERNNTAINIDLWGFGQSPEPPSTYGIYDYAHDVYQLLDSLGYNEYNIIGHSFGGRIAIIIASGYVPRTYPDMSYSSVVIPRLVLVDSAGIRPRRGLRYYYKVYSYKLRRRIGIKSNKAGSVDYQSMSDSMKPVFVRVVNTHLNKLVGDIKSSTLILWGRKDKDTPLYMAKYLQKNIADSGIYIWDNCGHYSYLERYLEFIKIVNTFFGIK